MTRCILLPTIRIERLTMPRSSCTVSLPADSTTDTHPASITYNHLLISSEVFSTTGAQAQRSSPRLTIVSLQENEKQFSLFVQTFSEWIFEGFPWRSCALTFLHPQPPLLAAGIEKLPSSVLLTYYQNDGIHGLPQCSWDLVPQTVTDPAYGHCHHELHMLVTWRRP
jgi:hypothetical protein